MRRLLSTLTLLAVSAGLGAYIYYSKPPEPETAAKEKAFPGIVYDQIAELTVRSKSGDVTTVKKAADGWQMVSPAAVKASESDIAAIGASLANLDVTRVIDDKATDLAPYGLDKPQMEVGYKSADGKSGGTIQIGQLTATGQGMYAKRVDQPRVFIVPSYVDTILNKTTFDLRDKAVVSFQRDKVDGITVTSGSQTVQLAKRSGDWTLLAPSADRADSAAVTSLMDRVESTQMKSTVAENPSPADLKKFGLDKPVASVEFKQGNTVTTLVVGGNADPMTAYARDTAKSVVVTVDSGILDDLRKSADAYRRKELFDLRPFTASHVVFTRGSEAVTFERVKGEKDAPDTWRRVSPNGAAIDTSKIETMLGNFADLRITDPVDGGAKTGLETPALVVTATFGEDKKQETVRFGKAGADVFGRAGTSPAGKIDADKYTQAIAKLDEIAK